MIPMQALSITDLTKTYKNGVHALKGISIDVAEGDFFALLGPNGAGKTTLIGIITSLVTKTSGKVFIFDKDIDTDFPTAKSYIGVVPQEFNFNPYEKVWHIVMNQAGYYGVESKTAAERAEFYLKKMALWEKRDSIVRYLSGGMKRRLMIARALMHQPKLLILDEPTAGVDVEVRRLTWNFLREINQQGLTIILTTHYLEEAENLCKHIAIIDHGKIIENSSMSDLLYTLQVETFILYLREPLATAPVLPGYNPRLIDNKTLEIDLESSQGINPLFNELIKQGIEVASMRNKSNRLEELFIHLTSNKKP